MSQVGYSDNLDWPITWSYYRTVLWILGIPPQFIINSGWAVHASPVPVLVLYYSTCHMNPHAQGTHSKIDITNEYFYLDG